MAAAGDRKAVRHRPRLGQGAERRTAEAASTSTRSTGSIIISARRRCRTSWCCASPTACSSRSGIATTSTMSRSRSPRQLGVGHRGSFYDATGALRDMVPNHLFQLLSLIAMEPPIRFDAAFGARREGRGARGDPAARARARRCAIPCAASTGPARIGDSRDRGLSQDRGRRARQHDRDLCRAEAHHRQLALGRRAVLSAHRQGARRQAHRRSRSSSSRRRSRCSATRRWTRWRRTTS